MAAAGWPSVTRSSRSVELLHNRDPERTSSRGAEAGSDQAVVEVRPSAPAWRRPLSHSMMEIGVQHPHLGDPIHWEVVPLCDPTDSLWRGCVVDAEGLFLIRSDIGVYPGDLILTVHADHSVAGFRTALVGR